MKIGIDVDGVLLDWGEIYKRYKIKLKKRSLLIILNKLPFYFLIVEVKKIIYLISNL